MNAPTEQHLSPALRALPITEIQTSRTHVQALRRARFTEEELADLAASFRDNGVVQPIIVRPAGVQYEIIAGERRWRAAGIAGLDTIPAIVRDMTDEQVLEVQIIENLQRKELLPLEEAEGYRELMRLKSIAAEDVGELVGKSRSWVYGRLKLLGLPEEAQAALQKGELDASRALLVARIADPKRQAKALKLATMKDWRGTGYQYSYRALREELERTGATANLTVAVFRLDDDTYNQVVSKRHQTALPACTACPNRDGDVCTDVPCYESKTELHGARLVQQARNEGRTVLTGKEAKEIAPDKYSLRGYVDLDQVCEDDEPAPLTQRDDESDEDFEEREDQHQSAHTPRTHAQLLDGADYEVTLLQDPRTKRMRRLVDVRTAMELIKERHGIELPAYLLPETAREVQAEEEQRKRDWAAERKAEEDKQARELEGRRRVLAAIAAKKHGPLTRDDLLDIVERLLRGDYRTTEGLKHVYDPMPEPGQLKDADLTKFIRLATVARLTVDGYSQPGALNAMAKRFGIDVARVKAGKPEKAAKPAAKKAAPAKKAKVAKGKKK